jgi:hypothetical protein
MGQPSEVIQLVVDGLGETEAVRGLWVLRVKEHGLELGEEAAAARYG